MLRATAAPERFLTTGGFARFLSRSGALRRRKPPRAIDLGVTLPADLLRFLAAVSGGSVANFVWRSSAVPPRLSALLSAERGSPALARLVAWLAGAVPFGETKSGEILVYFLADAPTRGMIASIEPRRLKATLICRGAATWAVICTRHVLETAPPPTSFGIADDEAIRVRIERARVVAAVLQGSNAKLRTALHALSLKPLDVPPAEHFLEARLTERTAPLAFGALVEAFFRKGDAELASSLAAHAASPDSIVRDIVALLTSALGQTAGAGGARKEAADAKKGKKLKRVSELERDLARRRKVALRSARPSPPRGPDDAAEITRRIIKRFDELPPSSESFAAIHEREETLLALSEVGDRGAAPALLARALTGDAAAVEMLAALGDRTLVSRLDGLLGGEPTPVRVYEVAVVRMMAALGAREALPALRQLLQDNPMTNWREGLERGVLVRELVLALGELEDEASSKLLVEILESTSQEYRSVLPSAAFALGRLRHVPALTALERLLFSPKEPVTCEAVWAVGAIGHAHASARERAGALLDRLTGLEPGAEMTRLAALAKVRSGKAVPRPAELRRALDRALWEPAFRQEETSRRRGWALRALEELATIARTNGSSPLEAGALFLGHEAIRHLVTRDDHRVRKAAESAFAAWALPVPTVRRYFAFVLPELERQGGLDALLEAVRDPLGIFRHNVATHLAAMDDPRTIRPLAEATARLFAEPPTSTYEYDDAPPHLVAFVRALARLNKPETNDVLIEGLRSDNHQVRAVIAENAPEDERFVPELMAMLGDPRSFLRSRAEKSLASLGAIPAPAEPNTTEIPVVARISER